MRRSISPIDISMHMLCLACYVPFDSEYGLNLGPTQVRVRTSVTVVKIRFQRLELLSAVVERFESVEVEALDFGIDGIDGVSPLVHVSRICGLQQFASNGLRRR